MKLITLSFSSPTAFMKAVQEVSIFQETRVELELGESVVLEVSFPGLVEPIVARAAVIDLTPEGALYRIQDEASMEFLKDVASGVVSETAQRERRFQRYPIDIPASCRMEGKGQTDEVLAETVDVGPGGACLVADKAPALGSRVRVVLGPTEDNRDQFVLFGDVAWIGTVGNDQGFGVQFLASAGDGTRLRQMIRKSRETGELRFAA